LILTGGADGKAVVFNNKTQKVVESVEKHNKKINAVAFMPDESLLGFAVCSADNTGSFYLLNNDTSESPITQRYLIQNHSKALTSLSFHPLKEYALFGSLDGFWSYHSLLKAIPLTKQALNNGEGAGITSLKFHPDGLIFATGDTKGALKIWDITTQSNISTFDPYTKDLNSISFSENGYLLATSGVGSSDVKIYDLRKPGLLKTITSEKEDVKNVEFDYSGTYLGFTGHSTHVYSTKNWSQVANFKNHTDVVTSMKFGKNAKFVVTTSLDRTMKIYSN